VSSGVQEVRRLVEHRGAHQVVSLYLDLDPERFATPKARSSQIGSLMDSAHKDLEEQQDLDHEDRIALREDLKRVRAYLSSPEAPFKGARALAVFCSSRDNLFETVQLRRPVPGQVVIGRSTYIAPMIESVQQRRWLVALVNRRIAVVLAGAPDDLIERRRREDNVPGQQHQGGWSQANYERSVEKDVDDHLKETAELVARQWRRERFDRLALGGPEEIVPRFEGFLPDELRAALVPERVDVDLSSATDAEIREAVNQLAAADGERLEREALDTLAERLGAGGRAAAGPADTVAALNERRLEMLLLDPNFDGQASRCPSCGLLVVDGDRTCPADGTELEPVEHLREAVVEAAVSQDADVHAVRHFDDLQRHSGIAALLRF
jgi:peptide subunit release factor 1 (eRF1)